MATALTRVILDRDPELRDAWVNLTPMGRIGEPEDLKGALSVIFSRPCALTSLSLLALISRAGAVIYLASDASAFTTGAEIIVDGGYTRVRIFLRLLAGPSSPCSPWFHSLARWQT